MRHNLIETVMGAVVIVIAGFFLGFAYVSADLTPTTGYPLSAKFERIDGLHVGNDVRLGGVKVGVITDQRIDTKTYLAVVTLEIAPNLLMPQDTSAEIASEGLLGGKYIALVPGGSDETIRPGGEIIYTQSSVSLESLIGKMIYNEKKTDDAKSNS
ncbi:MAG: outer membrane lipid asymmetry maintenance protein MlaD [Pseudomonadota bacterium]